MPLVHTVVSSDYMIKIFVDDLKSHSLTLTEAVNMAENWPVGRLLAMSEHGSELASRQAAGYE